MLLTANTFGYLRADIIMKAFVLTSALILEVGEEHQLLRKDKQA